MNIPERKISDYISGLENVAVAFLFGSQLSGNVHPESDVDIAILFTSGNVPTNDMQLDLKDRLSRILKSEADVVVLNNASPIIKMQVLKNGKKIIELDRRAYVHFFVRTINEYDDLKRVRAINENNILKGRIYD
ncbi:MAG: nucleotidyltransferase domain-containing protein [Balneolaceae bacterium]|nr:MAG: nucleotidyltransferase domain-containing protein [Balneolaceae bacterium]